MSQGSPSVFVCDENEPTITRPFICLTTIAKQRITMHINLFFLNNHVGTPKGLLQEYLYPFWGNKVQKVRVLLGGGVGRGGQGQLLFVVFKFQTELIIVKNTKQPGLQSVMNTFLLLPEWT